MPDIPQKTGWYDITKDIIIPLLGVISTIVIGVVITVLLNRKEEKAKIKALLIDNYMLYLNCKVNFFAQELSSFTYNLYKYIHFNYAGFFGEHTNSHVAKDKINERRINLKTKLDKTDTDASNWSPFTFRFAFLLGKKQYGKEAQKLENDIVDKYLADTPRNAFFEKLKQLVKDEKELAAGISAASAHEVDDALDKMEDLIAKAYNDFQKQIFIPYDNKIASLIDKY